MSRCFKTSNGLWADSTLVGHALHCDPWDTDFTSATDATRLSVHEVSSELAGVTVDHDFSRIWRRRRRYVSGPLPHIRSTQLPQSRYTSSGLPSGVDGVDVLCLVVVAPGYKCMYHLLLTVVSPKSSRTSTFWQQMGPCTPYFDGGRCPPREG